MDNFDLKKFLKENKALENLNPTLKALNENEMSMDKKMTKEAMKKQIKDMIVAELDSAGDLSIDTAPGIDAYKSFSEGEYPEDEEDTYDYSNDFYDGDSNDFGDTDEFDGYGGYDIDEAKKKDEEVEDVEDVEVTDTEEEMPADEAPAEEAPAAGGGLEDLAADMKGTEADLMDNLMKAFQIAKGMGNEKLETQVGNTLKFFVSEYIGGGEG